ncbi:ankyrin repeat domain-containing protein 24 [Patella vulgata]|nr:ankyrin repeat domain-containing protein 24 [Patella vulgata]XP_050418549.1 ankyrin repeat domain-containing protein 24 [Patella vulgata]
MNMDTDDEDDCGFLGYGYEDLTFLEACLDSDIEAIQAIIEENPTEDEINERDRSGRTGMSHICAAGLYPAIDILSDAPEIDINIPDKEGNSPLIFAAQAGHTDVVRLLLQEYKGIRIDHANKLGFTALMKAAIQGRTDCSRLLLYAGADPKLRDHGRKLCAEEWARYCGRKDCAEAISKFSNTKRFLQRSRLAQATERCSSVPDLASDIFSGTSPQQRQSHKRQSLRKKIKKMLPCNNENIGLSLGEPGSPFAVIARCVSSPVLPGVLSPVNSPPSLRRPVSADDIPKVEITLPYDEEEFMARQSELGIHVGRGRRQRKCVFVH